jgi:uncharacterized damage-inducible protein DinB
VEPGFEAHLSGLNDALVRGRDDLLATVSSLSDADLSRARRGGWPIAKVLEHIIGAEWHYARLVSHLRGASPAAAPDTLAVDSLASVRGALGRSRAALLGALEGVTEDEFYRLGTVGREEYSVVSVLENVDQHDVEHLGQIRAIAGA